MHFVWAHEYIICIFEIYVNKDRPLLITGKHGCNISLAMTGGNLSFVFAYNKGIDQPAHLCRLVSDFVITIHYLYLRQFKFYVSYKSFSMMIHCIS